MKKIYTLPPQVTPQVTLFQTPHKPLKTEDFHHCPSLTTPPHRNFVEVVRYGSGVWCRGVGSGVGGVGGGVGVRWWCGCEVVVWVGVGGGESRVNGKW